MINNAIICPRCHHAFVNITYIDTAGPHWICPVCGRNSDSYTLVYDTKTRTYKEMEEDYIIHKKKEEIPQHAIVCPRCHHAFANITYVDTTNPHWICPSCGMSINE